VPSRVTAFVDGAPVQGEAGTLASTNPARLEEVVAEVQLSTAAQVVAAFRSAKAAQPAWAATPAPVRGKVIAAVGRLVEDNKQALAELVTREVGKPLAEALGEVQEIIDTCDFFLGEGRRLYGQTVPSEMRDKQLFTFRMPVGVAGIITAGNFPVAVPSWYLVPALLCGNAVVWKPAEYSSALGDALTRLFVAGGVPSGVLNTVYADGPTTYDALSQALTEGLVNKIGFTGSSEVGVRIGELAGRHLQNPCLELGGKNPLVVLPDADLDLAAEGALFSGFGTAGQRCTSLGVAIVHEDVHEAFLEKLLARLADSPVGDPMQDVLYGPMLSERFLHGWEKWLGEVQPHHTVHGPTGRITSANPREGFVGDPDAGVYAHPVVVSGVQPDDALYRNETFGPLVSVMTFSTFDEAVELANGHGYGLSAAIYTRDAQAAFRFRERVSAGMLSVNNSTSGAEAHLPFGGNGKSGNGSRQSGVWVLDQFTRWQSMNWDYAGKLQKAQMDTEAGAGGSVADPRFRLQQTP
jgi:acyl-CoA reductase-like NAD-dependent aldehyde dehydrogenase